MSKVTAAQLLLSLGFSFTYTILMIRGRRGAALMVSMATAACFFAAHVLLGDVGSGWLDLLLLYCAGIGGVGILGILVFAVASRLGWVKYDPHYRIWGAMHRKASSDIG